MRYENILYDVRNNVATITLNRPEKLNCWTDAMGAEVWSAAKQAEADEEVRTIVLTGAGKAFCAGADISQLRTVDPASLATKMPRSYDMNRRSDYQGRNNYFPSVLKPVIGMLNGATAGIGLVYAVHCDIRFASDAAVFTSAFARRGLSAEYGLAWTLRHLVGPAHAADILLSSRRVDAREALAMGLVNKVCESGELRKITYEYAEDIARNCSPRSTKALKYQLSEAPFQTLAEAVMLANQDMVVGAASNDFKEGIASFFEKRPPKFSGS